MSHNLKQLKWNSFKAIMTSHKDDLLYTAETGLNSWQISLINTSSYFLFDYQM